MLKFNLSKKYSKTIPIIVLSAFVLVIVAFISTNAFKSFAAPYTDIPTRVTIGNTSPTFSSFPVEETPSTSTAPTAIGGTVKFNATATDVNGESYYLIVCSTDSVTPGVGGAAPTCGGTEYCKNGTSPVASGVATTCSYTALATDAWSNAWYAFVCDNNSTQPACSPSSQGSGTPTGSESPFFVNHPPAFTVISSNTPQNPGSSITWTSTASDTDTGSTVKLLVCKTNAMSSGTCTGGAWCTSTAVAADPTCSYSIPTPTADGNYDTWVFVVDQFNLGAAGTGTKQGTESDYVVNNVAPVVSSVTLNGGSPIALSESTTTNVSMTAVVTDNNGCTNQGATAEITSVNGFLYRSSVTYLGCLVTNANNCYYNIGCTVSVACNVPTGVTTYTCTTPVQYYAEPTLTDTPYSTDNWMNTIKATDDDGLSHYLAVSAGVELNTLIGGNTTPTLLDYGTIAVGGQNGTAIDLTTTPTGNVGLDALWKADGPNMCVGTYSNICSNGTPIPITHQHYALASATTYAAATALSTTDAELELNIPKYTGSNSPSGKTWWRIQIPTGTVAGVYNGLNRITYKMTEVGEW